MWRMEMEVSSTSVFPTSFGCSRFQGNLLSSFNINKSSLSFNGSFKVALLTFSVLVSCSIKVDFALLDKVMSFFSKMSAGCDSFWVYLII